MDLMQLLLQAQNGGTVRQLGDQFGLDAGQTQSALGALLPVLAGAMQQNAQAPGGMESLLGALAGGGHGRYLEEPSMLRDPSTVADGNGILGHLLGAKEVSREVAQRASAQTGIGADVLRKMLPVVAALLMGGLSRRMGGAGQGGGLPGGLGSALGGGGSGGGLGDLLGGALGGALGGGRAPAGAGPGGGLMDMLGPLLDRNRDGSAVDDVLKMAAGFLTRR